MATTFYQIISFTYREEPAVYPFTYNVSAWSQRIPICIIGLLGFLAAIVLGLYQWELIGWVWDPFFDAPGRLNGSEYVISSQVSHTMESWFHIPDGVFGAIAYLGDALFGLAGSTRRWQYRPWLVIIFGFDVIPLGIVGVILVVMQGLVVGHWCTLCLISAVISLYLIYLAYDEVWCSLVYLHRVKIRAGGYNRAFWQAFWGVPNEIGHAVGEEMIGNAPAESSAQPPLTPSS